MKILKILSAFFSGLFKGNFSGGKKQGPSQTIDFYSNSGTKKTLSKTIGEVLDQKRKPVLFFHADWCAASVKFKAGLKDSRLREALKGATLIIIDADSDPDDLSHAYHIRHVPAFVCVNRDGSAIKTITGDAWGEDLIANMASVMKQFLA